MSYSRRLKDFLRRYKRNKPAVFGLLTVIFYIFLAILAPYLTAYDPMRSGKSILSPPSLKYLMGTDYIGRDIYSGVLYGARVSLMVGFAVTATSLFIGILIGSVSAYFGGLVDDLLMRVTEVFQVLPSFFLMIILVAFLGSNIRNIIIVLGFLGWPGTARLIRSQVLSIKEREYVEAARAAGSSNLNVLFDEILPNAAPPVTITISMGVGSAILAESGISFIGLGDPMVLSWGRMISMAGGYLRRAWWMGVFPGLAILFLVLGLNLIADGLNDALNPRLREL